MVAAERGEELGDEASRKLRRRRMAKGKARSSSRSKQDKGGAEQAFGIVGGCVMDTTRYFQHAVMLTAKPEAEVGDMAAGLADAGSREELLVRNVIVDDPLAPELVRGIEVELSASPEAGSRSIAGGSRDRRSSIQPGNEGLNPGVSVAGADDVVGIDLIELSATKSGDDARGNANGSRSTAMDEAKYSQCPRRRWKRKSAIGSAGGSAGSCKV